MIRKDVLDLWAKETEASIKDYCPHCKKALRNILYNHERKEGRLYFVAYCAECCEILFQECKDRI